MLTGHVKAGRAEDEALFEFEVLVGVLVDKAYWSDGGRAVNVRHFGRGGFVSRGGAMGNLE